MSSQWTLPCSLVVRGRYQGQKCPFHQPSTLGLPNSQKDSVLDAGENGRKISIAPAKTLTQVTLLFLGRKLSLMRNHLENIEAFQNHIEASKPAGGHLQSDTANFRPRIDYSFWSGGRLLAIRRYMNSVSMLNIFNLPGLPWGASSNGDEKVELTAAEVESLRSEIADAEERVAHLKAQLEHIDELLRSARLSGYLYIRNRWTALPGEPPIEDSDVDDWLPRFVVLHGSCIFFYLQSTDLSPQDSTLLSDIVEVGTLPSFLQDDQQTRYAFYILTCHGLRFECSSLSEIQVSTWLAALRNDCNLGSDTNPKDSMKS